MKKVLFVATVVKTHIMEFHVPYLQMFRRQGWETAVAARNDYEDPADCVIPFCDRYYDVPFARSPLAPENLRAYRMLKELIGSGRYDIIHCHTPVGAMLARLAARKARKSGTRVIYTAHGFHFFKGAPLLNWLVYYPAERWLSRYTDTLVAINREDYAAAKKLRAKEVRFVRGVGVDTRKFAAAADREAKRTELGLGKNDFVLLSVGELIPRKNHAVVLRALAELKKEGKLGDIRYLICGRGAMQAELEALAAALGVAPWVRFLGYRDDVAGIMAACDLFVFMSLQEGLPVALMEAMAGGLPCVCSGIRGNTDLIRDGENGRIAPNTPRGVAEAIGELRARPERRSQLAQRAQADVGKYDIRSVKQEMFDIYFPPDGE